MIARVSATNCSYVTIRPTVATYSFTIESMVRLAEQPICPKLQRGSVESSGMCPTSPNYLSELSTAQPSIASEYPTPAPIVSIAKCLIPTADPN